MANFAIAVSALPNSAVITNTQAPVAVKPEQNWIEKLRNAEHAKEIGLAAGISAAGILGGIGGSVHSTQKTKKREFMKRQVINRAVQMHVDKQRRKTDWTIENPVTDQEKTSIRKNFEYLEHSKPNTFRVVLQAAAKICYPRNYAEFLKSFGAQHSSRDKFVLLNVDKALELMASLKGEAFIRALNEEALLQPVEA